MVQLHVCQNQYKSAHAKCCCRCVIYQHNFNLVCIELCFINYLQRCRKYKSTSTLKSMSLYLYLYFFLRTWVWSWFLKKYTASTCTVLFLKSTKKYMYLFCTCTWEVHVLLLGAIVLFEILADENHEYLLEFWIFPNQNFRRSDLGWLHFGCRSHAKWSDLGKLEKVQAQVLGLYLYFWKVQIHICTCTVLWQQVHVLYFFKKVHVLCTCTSGSPVSGSFHWKTKSFILFLSGKIPKRHHATLWVFDFVMRRDWWEKLSRHSTSLLGLLFSICRHSNANNHPRNNKFVEFKWWQTWCWWQTLKRQNIEQYNKNSATTHLNTTQLVEVAIWPGLHMRRQQLFFLTSSYISMQIFASVFTLTTLPAS